jgi:hypothetical protein
VVIPAEGYRLAHVQVAGPASGKTTTLAARGLLFMDAVVVEDLPPPGELPN